ncbi:hypothetical protein [Deinococcus hopiensis]|uniref:hypothetical protein n=1 Tax=Deinococcus hopiensis TaxID=309885 RepID=UPI0009FC8E28
MRPDSGDPAINRSNPLPVLARCRQLPSGVQVAAQVPRLQQLRSVPGSFRTRHGHHLDLDRQRHRRQHHRRHQRGAPHVAGPAILACTPSHTAAQVANALPGNATTGKVTNAVTGSPNRLRTRRARRVRA